MPGEIGPPISRISPSEQKEEDDPQITQIDADLKATTDGTQVTQNEKDGGGLYRGRYVETDRISSEKANTSHKVIYCVATLK